MYIKLLMQYPGRRSSEAPKAAREAAHAIHAVLAPRLGRREGGKSRPQTMGDWANHRRHVEGPAGDGESCVY